MTLNRMEEIKEKVNSLKDREINLSQIEAMNHAVQEMIASDGFFSTKKSAAKQMILQPPMYQHQLPIQLSQKKSEFRKDDKTPSMASMSKDNIIYSPPDTLLKDESLYGSQRYNRNDIVNTEKRIKRRFLEIGSHSLRNLKKEFESKDEEDEEGARDKAISSLNDWINRRITGYLIFQNTINTKSDEKSNYRELGIHLNSIAGQKWKGLTEEEKEEYKNLAKKFRKTFREEIENYENYDDFTSLIEKLDIKIKKLKKE